MIGCGKDVFYRFVQERINEYSQSKIKCYYAVADVVFADTKVRLFFIRRGRQGAWNGQ